MSIYLARDFAQTNKNLFIQLEQVQILSAQTIEQEHEKQKMLNEQNALLEQKVNERTIELVKQKELVDKAYQELHQKNKEVLDSIHYAKRIQTALITSEKTIEKSLNRLMKES
jgi:serine phosphatase RsbU (regulator of sigma subunit)